jgi:uncharacterized protein YbaR (Trm112 family)
MPLDFDKLSGLTCPYCNAQNYLWYEWAAQKVKCPKCMNVVGVVQQTGNDAYLVSRADKQRFRIYR